MIYIVMLLLFDILFWRETYYECPLSNKASFSIEKISWGITQRQIECEVVDCNDKPAVNAYVKYTIGDKTTSVTADANGKCMFIVSGGELSYWTINWLGEDFFPTQLNNFYKFDDVTKIRLKLEDHHIQELIMTKSALPTVISMKIYSDKNQ